MEPVIIPGFPASSHNLNLATLAGHVEWHVPDVPNVPAGPPSTNGSSAGLIWGRMSDHNPEPARATAPPAQAPSAITLTPLHVVLSQLDDEFFQPFGRMPDRRTRWGGHKVNIREHKSRAAIELNCEFTRDFGIIKRLTVLVPKDSWHHATRSAANVRQTLLLRNGPARDESILLV